MSHFTVLVIGKNPEEQLAPFQENNMGDCPKEFLKYRVWDEEGNDHWFGSEEEFKASGIKSESESGGYWENPNKKWDWYQLGGRWTGFFKMKLGVVAEVGEPGILTAEAPKGYADQCLKGDVDFEYMRKEAELKAAQKYDFAISIIENLPVNKSWEEVKNEVPNIEEARKVYWEQERCKAFKEAREKDWQNWPLSYDASADDFIISKQEYLQQARQRAISTFAVIKDGQWYERGKMGWFATVVDEKEESNWNKEYTDLLDELPDDTLLSIYDCHI